MGFRYLYINVLWFIADETYFDCTDQTPVSMVFDTYNWLTKDANAKDLGLYERQGIVSIWVGFLYRKKIPQSKEIWWNSSEDNDGELKLYMPIGSCG